VTGNSLVSIIGTLVWLHLYNCP